MAQRLHEAQRRHVVVVVVGVGSHARLRLFRHGPGKHFTYYPRTSLYLWHPLHVKRDLHAGAVKTERTTVDRCIPLV